MGDIYWSLHIPLANALIRQFQLTTAVETGTYFASGAIHLASLCKKVYTIENDPRLSAFAKANYGHLANVQFVRGMSSRVLPAILENIEEPTLFVLDAHWFDSSPRSQFLKGSQCPVLDELNSIEKHCRTRTKSAIIIDDADMFLGALPSSFKTKDFPSITKVIDSAKRALPSSVVDVIDDLILVAPPGLESVVADYTKWKCRVGTPKTM